MMRRYLIFVSLWLAFIVLLAHGCGAHAQTLSGQLLYLKPSTITATCRDGDFRVDVSESPIQLKMCISNVWEEVGGGGGTVQTASNVGSGAGVFKQLNVADLEFKSLTAGTGIVITPGTDEIEIEAIAQSPLTFNDTATIDLTESSDIVTADVVTGSIGNTQLGTGIDVSQFADGSVSDTEFQYLDGVSSDIQTQLDGKEAALTFSAPLSRAGDTISIPAADTSTDGYLTQTDWDTFNGKQAAGNYITALTGDVTATGPGSVAATIAADAVTNAKLADAPSGTIKGNNTGGADNPLDLTGTQVTALLDAFVGDSGAGGTKGLVPAPSIGDGDALKLLSATGSWIVNFLSDLMRSQLGQESNALDNGGFEDSTTGWACYSEASEANTFTDTGELVTATAHGFINGDRLIFTSITTTTGISTNTIYYVISATANTFQVSATSGGSALPLTSDGSGQFKRLRPLLPPNGGSPTVTISTTSTNPIEGSVSGLVTKDAALRIGEGCFYSFSLPANAAGTVQNFSIAYYVNSGTYAQGDATLYLYDDTNDTLQYELPLTNTSASSKQYFNGSFISGSTSYKAVIAVTSVSASAWSLKLDSFRVSASTPQILNVAQSRFIGSAYYPTTVNCVWQRGTASMGAFGADADCPAPIVIANPGPGLIQATDADLPQFTLSGLTLAGWYRVVIRGPNGASTNLAATFSINDGSKTYEGPGHGYGTNSGQGGFEVEAWFKYDSAPGTKTFALHAYPSTGTVNIENDLAGAALNISITHYPHESSLAVTADQTDFGPTNYGEMTITAVTTPPTKSVAKTQDKIIVERKGRYAYMDYMYQASTAGSAGSGEYIFHLPAGFEVDTTIQPAMTSALGIGNPNDAQPAFIGDGHVGATGGGRGGVWCFLRSSTTFSCASIAAFTSYTALASNAFGLNVANLGFKFRIKVPIVGWRDTSGSPVILNQVSTPARGGKKTCSGFIANSGTPSVTRSEGNCVSSVTDNGTGDVSINFVNGTFSSAPWHCSCTASHTNNVYCNLDNTTALSASVARFQMQIGTTGGPSDQDFTFECTGSR